MLRHNKRCYNGKSEHGDRNCCGDHRTSNLIHYLRILPLQSGWTRSQLSLQIQRLNTNTDLQICQHPQDQFIFLNWNILYGRLSVRWYTNIGCGSKRYIYSIASNTKIIIMEETI